MYVAVLGSLYGSQSGVTPGVTRAFISGIVAIATLIAGCGGSDTESNIGIPGSKATPATRALDAGASALQSRPPIDTINAYLNGFHFYSGDLQSQMEAHHYCAIVSEDVIQCVIYDGNVKNAKLMGVEYIVSERLFKSMPDTEKALWHSHVHEVKSGQLVAPGLPTLAENELMKKLVGTYGKTWHTWHTDRHDELPIGTPHLMMGFTADGQAHPEMVTTRDERMGVDSVAKRKQREDIVAPVIVPGADAWQKGNAGQAPSTANSPHRHTPKVALPR